MKIRPRLLLFTITIIILVFAGGFLIDKSQSTIAFDQPNTDISLGVSQSQQVVVRFYYESQEQLEAVAGQLDVWEVDPLPGIGPASGYAVAAVYPAEQDWLETLGYRVEIDPEKTAMLQNPAAVLDPRYYYFDNFVNNPNDRYMVDFLQAINTSHPELTELLDVGDGWLTGHFGHHRDIWVLRISNEDPQYGDIANKPVFFMMANIHAREVSTPEMAIRYIKYLTDGYNGQGGYGLDPDVTWLVNHHATYVLISINPDGRVINELDTSAWWRKNVDNDDGCADQYNWGVDLNRNSNFKWGCCGGSSGNPCAETYRGPSRSSEPETMAFQGFAASVLQDWNGNNGDDEIVLSPDNASGIFLTLHSYADDILWPWGFAPGTAPNDNQLETIGRKLADLTPYMVPTGGIGYPVDGSSDDWVYGKLGVAAFTFEIGPNYGSCGSFFPAYGCQDGIDGMPRNFWTELKNAFLYMDKIAATPYVIAYGPDAQDLAVSPADVPGGTPVDLTGTVLDQRYGGDTLQPIAGAEYFIDAPGADGTGFPMSPSDGAWGETNEPVEAVVDTTGLSQGQHYILVHGQNDDGFWGPYTAVFLNVSTPAYGVMLTPETDEALAEPGVTVTYTLEVSNIGMNEDTYDIAVESQWAYNSQATVGPVAAGDSATFNVEVTVPVDAANGESDVAMVTASSQYDPQVHDVSFLTTTANVLYGFAVEPVEDTLTAFGRGSSVEYTLVITNVGGLTDTYSLAATSDWPIGAPSELGPLAPGASASLAVTVYVPIDISIGESNDATLVFTSQGNASSHTIHLYTNTTLAEFYLPISQKP
jgi:hypothetical protein